MDTPYYVSDFWAAYGNSSALIEVYCDDDSRGGSLARHVLEKFDIPFSGAVVGGNLTNLDIKSMDAMAVIQLSLLEALGDSSGLNIFEPMVNPDGEVEFVEIGNGYPTLDIYHKIQTASYVDDCMGVLVRGGQPLPYWEKLDWKFIWGDDGKTVIDTTQMMANCSKEKFSTHATIIFDDPHLNTNSYNNGIDNLFDIIDPFQRLVGYVRYIHSENSTKDTEIIYNNSTVVPIKVSGKSDSVNGARLGKLYEKPTYDDSIDDLFDGENCWAFTWDPTVPADDGLEIVIPDKFRFDTATGEKIDKFVKVESVMFVGIEITSMQTGMLVENSSTIDTPTQSDIVAVINVDNRNERLFKLEEGNHYTISYKDAGSDSDYKVPYIVFAKDARVNEINEYGENTYYMVGSHSHIGTFKAGTTGYTTIFPVAGNKGFIVHEVWAEVRLDTPSISVYDPEYDPDAANTKAIDLANELEYIIAPIIVNEPPPPIAFNGRILNQEDAKPDTDPRTVQSFENTEFEEAMDELDGGSGLEISLPFLSSKDDEDKLAKISDNLYRYMNGAAGFGTTGVETTYVCGPNTTVNLGDNGPAGGIVNGISYSYTDSGSYTISVNEGAKVVGSLSGGGPTGPTPKTSETFSANGQIVDQLGNGMFFKVRIDGLGERVAINMSDSHLRIGDVVNCSIHNNPVEV